MIVLVGIVFAIGLLLYHGLSDIIKHLQRIADALEAIAATYYDNDDDDPDKEPVLGEDLLIDVRSDIHLGESKK